MADSRTNVIVAQRSNDCGSSRSYRQKRHLANLIGVGRPCERTSAGFHGKSVCWTIESEVWIE